MGASRPPEADRAWPSEDADLVVAGVLTLAALAATLLPFLEETPLRAALGFAFVLLVPGYALVSALFPGSAVPGRGDDGAASGRDDAPGGPARVALAVLTSVVLAAMVGGALSLTVGLGETNAVVALAAVSLGALGVAVRRRRALAPEERFAVPLRTWAAGTWTALTEPETRGAAALNVVLAVAVVVSVGGVAYATAVPGNQEQFTELYLLTDDGSGDLVAADYPTEFTAGDPRSQYVGVRNREGETVSYTLLVEIQRVTVTNDSIRVREREPLRRFNPQLADGESWRRNHTVAPTMTGEGLRLTYLLYNGSPPDRPTVDNADQHAYTWVTVSAPNGSAPNGSGAASGRVGG